MGKNSVREVMLVGRVFGRFCRENSLYELLREREIRLPVSARHAVQPRTGR